MVDEVLRGLSPQFDALYTRTGRPSIPPEKLVRALLLQLLYSVRSERQVMVYVHTLAADERCLNFPRLLRRGACPIRSRVPSARTR